MAPTTTTSMNTHMATEPTTRTESSTSSRSQGRGKATKPQAKQPARSEGSKQDSGKHNDSERRRRNNIEDQCIRLKEMIPSIKNVKGIENSEEKLLIAFDKEAQKQVARRNMLNKKIADIQQAINGA